MPGTVSLYGLPTRAGSDQPSYAGCVGVSPGSFGSWNETTGSRLPQPASTRTTATRVAAAARARRGRGLPDLRGSVTAASLPRRDHGRSPRIAVVSAAGRLA